MMSILERLTFARPTSFVIEGLVATIPIIFALLLQVEPTFFIGYSTLSIGVVALLLLLLISSINYWILLKAGSCTYSPSLHTKQFIGESVLCHQILSAILVYFGYLVLVFPTEATILPGLRDILAGLGISALFSVLLVSAHSTAVLSVQDKSEKERLIGQFFSESQKYASSTSAVKANEKSIQKSVDGLLKNLEDEPMPDAHQLETELREWTDAFKKYQTGGRQKMVGGVSDPDNLTDPWDSLYAQYCNICEKLNRMNSSNASRTSNG